MTVVERERLIIVVNFGQVGVCENFRQNPPLSAHTRLEATVFQVPTTIPALLVFPIFGIADAGLGLHIVEPGVFHAFAAGPHILAGNRTGVAADAFIKVEHLADLRANFHAAVSPSASGPSSQSTFSSLRTMTNSSRLDPTVP